MERYQTRLEGVLQRFLLGARAFRARTNCPKDEDLAAFLDGALNATEESELESHLAECRLCQEILVAAYRTSHEPAETTAPAWLAERAAALVPKSRSTKDILTLIVEFTRDSLELLSTSGRMAMPLLAAEVRGKSKTQSDRILQAEQDLDNYHLTVELERLDGELCQIAVNVKPIAGSIAEGLRFSLMSGDREQASYLARHGTAIFERVAPGDYELDVSESGNSLGVVRLTIKEWRHER